MMENGNNPTGADDQAPAHDDAPRHEEQDQVVTPAEAEAAELAEALAAQQAEEANLDPFELLQAENASLQDRLLRTAAEMENLRRRMEREKAEATLYAASNFARDMLNVSDNMDRALDAVGPEQRQAADEITTTLLDGVEMVRRELLNIFEKHGIRRLEPTGERFDPNLHQAMFEIPDETTPTGTVMQVVQPGYVIGERVLRPAMVGVSKGGPKPAVASDTADPAGDAPSQ
jgi:molecular chaperone GrpE